MYNKLFSKIVRSSVWLENTPTRFLWMMMIGLMDEDGFVEMATTRNLARLARLSHPQTLKALATLEGPDPNSSNPANEGRRLERVPGGWMVCNAAYYRDLATAERRRHLNRERVAKFRAKQPCNAPVMLGNGSETETETRSDLLPPPTPPSDEGGERVTRADRKWAEDVLRNVGDHCPHRPVCPNRYACIGRLVAERRLDEADGLRSAR